MNIFVVISLVCNLVMLGCVIYLRTKIDDRTDELRLLERLKDNEEGCTRSLERSAISAIKERDKYRGLVKELKDEITELKLERYKHISSYYKRNGGVEDE